MSGALSDTLRILALGALIVNWPPMRSGLKSTTAWSKNLRLFFSK